MCNHDWKQQDVLTRVCQSCGAIDTDANPSKYWITPLQCIRLGFEFRNKLGLLELTTIGKFNELPA